MMDKLLLVAVFGLLVIQCSPRTLPEESVVSDYTHEPANQDVYHQIATNIAERITSPIYRFLGISRNSTEAPTTKRSWDKIEILDDGLEDVTKMSPIDNEISNDKDVEELSSEALQKIDKKPEKITLYSSYLPTKGNIELNDTINEVSDDDDDMTFGFDDDEDEAESKPKQSTFSYVLEILGGIVQFIYSGIIGLFSSNRSS